MTSIRGNSNSKLLYMCKIYLLIQPSSNSNEEYMIKSPVLCCVMERLETRVHPPCQECLRSKDNDKDRRKLRNFMRGTNRNSKQVKSCKEKDRERWGGRKEREGWLCSASLAGRWHISPRCS